MIKTKDGYAKLIGTTYSGSVSRVLLSNGGDHVLGNSNGNIPLNNGTVNTNLNADMLDGLHIHAGRNHEVNKIVRTDASGHILAGWINTTSGDIGTGTINKIYCSNDDYIRYKTPANFFPTLANSGNNISITVAGLNRTLTVGYATNADTIDKYHANTIYNAPSFTVNNGNTSNTYILLATITISGTSLSCAEFTTLFQNRECLDSSSFILSGAIRRNSTTSVTATLSYITLHTKTPRNIYLRSDDGVTFRVYIQSAASTYTTYYRAIPIVDSRNITYSNTGTTSPISGTVLNITATKGGNVNYANSTGNADTLDSYHASGLLTALSNSNNGVSITVGGTTKNINNISVSYAQYLNSVNRMDYGWNGINYFNANLTAGCAAKANDSPTSNWWHILRFNHGNNNGYYTDLAIPFNSNSLYWKTVRNGAVAYDHWIKVLDSLNYNEFAPTKTGKGASGTWGISITGNADTVDGYHASKFPYINDNGVWKVYGNSAAAALADNTTGLSSWAFGESRNSGRTYLGILKSSTATCGISAHGTIVVFGQGDTHLGIASDYGSANLQVFGGNADKIVWRKKVAFTSDIPTVTNYWWANVKISNTSNTDTLPTFGFATIKNRLSIFSSTLTKTNPTHLQLVINGPNLDSSVTPGLKDWPGIGFHMPSKGWASLIYNGNITAINSNYDGYINYFGAGFKKNGSNDTYVLLGGGGHKLISDFAINNHTHSWSSITNKPCTLISYSRDGKNIDANNWRVKECSFIEIRDTELTYSNLAMSGYNSFFNFWTPDGIACTQFQIGDKAFYYRSKQSGSATITTSWHRVMDSNNCSVSKSGETLAVKINGTSQSLTNTWRGILDNLTSSTNTTQSLSAKLGYLLANGSARDNTKLPLSGGTMTGVIKSTFKSGSWINGVTNAVITGKYTDYGAILSMPVKDGRVSISSYPSNNNYIYFGYATTAYINAGTNDLSKKMYWDAANNKLVADTFLGALLGNATTATTATKLSTSSAGSTSLPVYFSNGIPVACTKSSIFSNLSNNGDQLSVTVAGYNRLLTVAFASRADSAVDADYAASSDWAEDALHASSADSATNADTLDGHHASEFASSGHTHTLKLESTTGTNSITLAHGGKYKLTAGGNSVIFTLPTNTDSIAFSGGLISSSNNTLTQASHSITIGGQTETAGYSTCNIINNLSINSLSSSSTTNLTAQITVNGITSALKTITQLHSRFWDVTRNSATSNISPGNYSATITEVQGNASGITGNLPTTSWYHVYTAAGQDTKYATLLALGMTTDGIWYRKYYNSSWGSWLTVLHSGNIGNYYWANISISTTRNTNTTPRFGQVKINTDSSSYQLNVGGDSYTTSWSRAKNGFYCEGNGVYFTHNGTKGEIAITSNNEFCWGSNSDTLYFNYASPSNGSPVKNYIWNAGSSDTYASHTTGNIILGSNSNSNYQLKRAGYEASWYNGRDRAIIRQTSSKNYTPIISSKTTNGSWEIGNNSNNLYFTYITDTNYNSATNVWDARLYFSSSGSMYAEHFYENSDIRYKKILKNLLINFNTIANLPLFDFEWTENNAIGTGTSALAVLLILPNLVSGTDRLTLDYGILGTIAGITACKELVTQKSELLQLKEKVKLLEDKLHKYENI